MDNKLQQDIERFETWRANLIAREIEAIRHAAAQFLANQSSPYQYADLTRDIIPVAEDVR